MSVGAADLAVVIPTRDRWPILRRTLTALAAQSVRGFEVVVVVDGEDQEVPALPEARVVVQSHAGPGAARNAGARATDRPLLLFLGDDMVPAVDLVAAHLAAHGREPDPAVAVLGRADWHREVRRSRLLRWLDWSASQFDYTGIQTADAGFGRFYSCNVSVKRDLFERAGGFDPDFTYYYEDLDLGWRLGQAGMVLRYAPDARVQHIHRYDVDGLRRRFRGIAAGEWLMTRKHDWFEPFFHPRVIDALTAAPVDSRWALLADLVARVPAGRRGDRGRAVLRRGNRWWHQQVGDAFLDGWEGARGLDELRDYLGDDYDERRLREHMHEVDAEERAAPDELTFYRTSTAYLYDLTVFAISATKTPYLQAMRRHLPPSSRLLDYGCGIGSDGLRLIDAGYHVDFADFANPSVDFLRWRLQQRGVDAAVHDVEQHVPGGYDGVYCFDVIEHVDDPVEFLHRLETLAPVVVVNFLEPRTDDVHVHKPLPVGELMAEVRRHQVLHKATYHGRSHLVIYRVG